MNTTNHNPGTHQGKNPASPFVNDVQARRVIASVARNALEVLNGYRAASNLDSILTIEEQRRLRKRTDMVSTYRTRQKVAVAPRIYVGGTNVCRVNSRVVETTTIVRDSLRVRFICMRWELKRGSWKVTTLEFG